MDPPSPQRPVADSAPPPQPASGSVFASLPPKTKIASALLAMATSAWCLGRVLGDGNVLTGLLFYVPTPVLAVSWLAMAAWLSFLRARAPAPAPALGPALGPTPLPKPSPKPSQWLALLAAVVGLLLAVELATVEIQWSRPAARPPSTEFSSELALVHWNVFRNYLPWKRKIERLRAAAAQIYVLNEVPRQVSRGNWALRLGPNMQYAMANLSVVACQGAVLGQESHFYDGLSVLEVDCRIEGQQLRIFAVDMPADPLVARDPLLARLVERIELRRPDLVAGDLNAPRRSLRLQPLPTGYAHAYEAAGAGWPFTWPSPLPVLAIDQCFFGPRIAPSHHRFVRTLASDHALQVFRFSISPSRPASDRSRGPS